MTAPATEQAATSTVRSPVKVLYLIGWGRSGSTLLDTLLGEVPGFFSAGELRNLWKEGLQEGRRCGCGRPVVECPVWSAVLERVRATGAPSPNRMARVQHEALRTRHTWSVIRRTRSRAGLPSTLAGYASGAEDLYAAIRDVTGARVVVDSSKVPPNAALLAAMPSVEPYLLHLVRDPRASAYSWQRQKDRLDGKQDETLPRFGLVQSSINWLAFNGAAEVLRRHDRYGYKLLRYEDFVVDPRGSLEGVVRFVGEPADTLPFTDRAVAHLGGNHTVSGNPSRFRTGSIEIRDDDEWRIKQHPSHRVLVTALTSPALARYGYDVSVRPTVGSAGV
jgi:hypothetical protein